MARLLTLARSDAGLGRGRLWSPDSRWNQPLGDAPYGTEPVSGWRVLVDVAGGPDFVDVHARPDAPSEAFWGPLRRETVSVVHSVREVWWEAPGQEPCVIPLDADGEGPAAGLLLEREVVSRDPIRHRLAFVSSEVVIGTVVALVGPNPQPNRGIGLFRARVQTALRVYGAECVGHDPDHPFVLRIARPASCVPPRPGPTYGNVGLQDVRDEWDLGQFEVRPGRP